MFVKHLLYAKQHAVNWGENCETFYNCPWSHGPCCLVRNTNVNQIVTQTKTKISPAIQAWQRLLVTHHHPASLLAFSGSTPQLAGLMAVQAETERPHPLSNKERESLLFTKHLRNTPWVPATLLVPDTYGLILFSHEPFLGTDYYYPTFAAEYLEVMYLLREEAGIQIQSVYLQSQCS